MAETLESLSQHHLTYFTKLSFPNAFIGSPDCFYAGSFPVSPGMRVTSKGKSKINRFFSDLVVIGFQKIDRYRAEADVKNI